MLIRTLWAPPECDDDMPWLADSVDEYTIDSLGGDLPDTYLETKTKHPEYRELIIDIPEKSVVKLFTPPTIPAIVESE